MVSASDVSASVPDWSRERVRKFFDPSRQLLRHIRGYQRFRLRSAASRWMSIDWLRSRWHVVGYRFWSVVAGAEINMEAQIGGGLLLPHPNGVVIHPDCVIGPNCLLFQQVTLGTGGRVAGCPTLGGHVDVGAGAKILGGIHIGDHASIGANAVVLDDVPPGATAVGVPARIIPQETRR
jgi:serine O-acetyltransferase